MKYRKKPVEAVQWSGQNLEEMKEFYPGIGFGRVTSSPCTLLVSTLAGIVSVGQKSWLVKKSDGKFYSYKPDIFEKTYEKVEDDK